MTMDIPARPRAARPLTAVRREPGASWYRIVNQADQPSAEIWLYDEIGAWGVSAGMFVAELTTLQVMDITLHVNSPGGDAWDGLAIYNALRTHPARVTVQVDGAAISAASFIAMAGDRIVTAAQSQWMIHEASGLCYGNCDDMTAMVVVLDQMSGMIAEIYNDRVRGGVTKWRNLMRAETWYTADEAVAAGLADEVAALPARQQDEALAASARWDLSVFAHPERAVALAGARTPESGDVPGPGAVDDAGAPLPPESPAAAAPPQAAAAGPRPALDVGRMRDVVSRAAHVPFELGPFRDAVAAAAGAPPAAEVPLRRAFPPAPAPLPAEPAAAPARASGLGGIVGGVLADAPAPAIRDRPEPAPPPLPPATVPLAPADPSAGNRASLRSAVGLAANDTPAPPPPPAPAAGAGPDSHTIDIGAFRRALRGATL